ncbi:MAG TPA: lipopolysaccharide heptosyltransferase II [Gemmatimonadaceae bacterium]|nr:lipopolysaccharide heptosyltransferase II [Gemmatimonadaceae bacterium]
MTKSGSLVVQTSFLGDTVLTTPLIAQLAERGAVDIVVTPASAPLLSNNPALREVIVYDKRGGDRGLGGFVRLARRLRRARYAYACLAQGSMRSASLVLAAGVPERIGFETSAGRRLYTTRVAYIENEHHAARLLRLAAESSESTPSAMQPRLYPGDDERHDVDALLNQHGWNGEPFIALAPGSVWATKRWPHYAELAAEIDGRLAIVGSGADRDLAAQISRAAGSRAIDCTGSLSLLGSAELIGRAQVLVTNDSSPLHLASAMGTPTVAIFGPTVPEFGFGPLAPRSRVLGVSTLACRPCDRHGPQRCPLGHWRCMREITPREVVAAVHELMASPRVPTSSR